MNTLQNNPSQKRAPYKGRVLNARPDSIDFRDNLYRPTLIEVPLNRPLDNYKVLGIPILDQGQEGACTGFGLATVVNYLNKVRDQKNAHEERSPRMLYEMAKKYDEWEGEDYIGSSARGAMKGWHKHGVCRSALWQYDPLNPDKDFSAERADDAARQPLGAYYRVNHKDLVDMHASITEVGILFATARVHDGWFNITEQGEIPYEGQEIKGGHAFAIVAFDENGFWIQNSWGKNWGKEGFAQITYDDWLANGTDAWVARLGAPVTLRSANSIAKSFSVAAATRDGLSFKDLRQHVVSLGNDGDLKTTGTYGNYPRDVERIFTEYIPAVTKDWNRKRIMLYAHGGLVSETSVLQRLADYRQTLLANEIYPIFFVWNSDIWSTIKSMLQDAFSKRKAEERVGSALDFMLDRVDDALEPLLRLPGKAAWDEMKENARAAMEQRRGAHLTLSFLKEYLQHDPKASLHLVGHSAGSIFLGPMVNWFAQNQIQMKSCILWAPACTMDDLEQDYLNSILENHIHRFTLCTLTDEAEQDDNCFHIYNKSLLYLVSHSFERIPRGTKILGMSKYLEEHTVLNTLIANKRVDWITSPNNQAIPNACSARHHGDFDNDVNCFKSTVARIVSADPAILMGDAYVETETMPIDGGEAGTRAGAVPSGGSQNLIDVPLGPSPLAPQIFMRPTKEDLKIRRNKMMEGLANR